MYRSKNIFKIEIENFSDISKYSISRYHTRIYYTCKICNERVNYAYDHFRHCENELICNHCNVSRKTAIRNSSTRKIEGWTCPGCNQNFPIRSELWSHVGQCEKNSEKVHTTRSRNTTNSNNKRIQNGEAMFRHHCYKYENIEFDSSWELAYWIFCKDKNIKIERNIKSFDFIFKNQISKFYPDFIVENQIVEIKGDQFLNPKFNGYEKWKSKIEQVVIPNKILVLYLKDLKDVFNYIHSFYGKKYLKNFKVY